MASTTSHTLAPGQPLLIAVAGLAPRTGVTTTAVALAREWPGPEPAVLVEADPDGGGLAELTGLDPYRGLASLAHAAHAGAGPVRVAQHLQFLAGGVGALAAPPGPDSVRDEWVTMLLTGRHHDRRLTELAAWRDLGATVFVDCGAPAPASPLTPILAAADACLILVHTDLTDPASAGHRIRELAGHSRHPGVLLIDSDPASDYQTALELPVLARLPHDAHASTALLKGSFWHRHNRLLTTARAVTDVIDTQLRPPAPTAPDGRCGQQQATPRTRSRRWTGPTVYRIDRPAHLFPAPGPAPRPEPHPGTASAGTDHVEGDHRPTAGTGESAPAATQPPRPPAPVHPEPEPGHPLDARSHPRAPARAASPTPISSPDVLPASGATVPPGRSEHGDEPVLAVKVFGPTRLVWRDPQSSGTDAAGVEITGRVQPRSRELLSVLALHPKGLGRAQLLEALWGNDPPHRPSHALSNLLSRLRTAIATATDAPYAAALLTDERMRYRLNPATVTVDYWEFTAAVTARRTARSEQDRAAACQRIIDIATTTPLGTDLSHPWLEPLREAARRDALNARGWLAAHTLTADPRTTLGMLETATETDPYNESLWQDILRLHARLGEHDALSRTFSLLTKKLAEIDTTPSRETRTLLNHLRNTTR